MRNYLHICSTASVAACQLPRNNAILTNYAYDIYCIEIVTLQVRQARFSSPPGFDVVQAAMGWSVYCGLSPGWSRSYIQNVILNLEGDWHGGI